MSTVALLGLGAMGQRMAHNLLQAGHHLHVWNRSPERCADAVSHGATLHASPREAARHAEVVMAMLYDDDASRSVWLAPDGAVHGLRPGSVAIECSTLSLGWCQALAQAVGAAGASFLDAPVVGSRPQAEAAQLIHLIGGLAETVARARPVLNANAPTTLHVGDTGQGMAMKLAVNALFGIQVAALAELLGFLKRGGIDAHTAAEVLGQLAVTSPAARLAVSAMAAQNFTPMFPVALVHKDFGCVLESAQALQAAIPTTTHVREQFSRAIQAGYGDENLHAVARLFY